jgi:hypothetical protein
LTNLFIKSLIQQTSLRYNTHQSVEERRVELERLIKQVAGYCADQVYLLRTPHGNEQVEHALYMAEKAINTKFE